MRKILFTLLAVGAMLTAIPAASLAHGGDYHQRDRHRERQHDRARPDVQTRHDHFGGQDGLDHDAGTVTSFVAGRLTIRLNDGSSATGTVDRFSEIECEMPDALRAADGGPGDDNGQDGPGHHAGDENGPGHHDGEHRCTTIAAGMAVHDATLTLTGFGAAWTHVDLIGS